MASSVGSLVARLGLDASDYISGLTKAEQRAKNFANNFEGTIARGIIKAEIALRAFGAAARTTFDVVQSLTVDAGAFKDLEETTGASAENLASLAVAGATAGVSMDSIGDAANKLTKSLVGVDDESKAAGAALKALGLNVKDFKQLDPVAQYEAVGKALAGFEDGAAKSAVAVALFGKAGVEQLKVFKALEEQGGRNKILTQQQIETADAFADAQAKAAAELRLYAQAAATEAIPQLVILTRTAVDLAKEFLGIDKVTGQLAANNGAREFAAGVADAFAFAADQVLLFSRLLEATGKFIAGYGAVSKALLGGDLSEARAAGAAFRADIDDLNKRLTFTQRLANQRAAAAQEASFVGNESEAERRRLGLSKPPRKKLDFNGPTDASAAAAEQKRVLDGQIKDIRAFADQQRDAYEFANRYVKGAQDAGLISLKEFFDAEDRLREAGLQSTLQSLDKEAAALRAARSKTSGADRVELENRIAEAVAKRAQAEQRASQDAILAEQQRAASTLQLQRRYEDLNATILELSGDTAGAAAIRIRQQVDEVRTLLRGAGQDTGAADRFGALLGNIERLKAAQTDYGNVVARSQLAEESILLAARESGATELETLRAVGAARSQSLAQMGQLVERAQQLAAALGTPDAIRFADDLAVQFKRAALEVDPLLLKIRSIGEEMAEAIVDPIGEAIVQFRGWSDLLGTIERQLLSIGTRELVTKPFGSLLSNVIGGNGAPSGGGGLIGQIAGFFGGLLADGGFLGAGKWGIAGERGPEIVQGPANIVPATRSAQMLNGGSSYRPIVMNFAFSGPVDRRTQQQVGAAAARGLSAASARNN